MAELELHGLTRTEKVKSGAVDTAVVVAIEAVGLALAPFTLTVSSVVSSLLCATYVALKDVGAGGAGRRLVGGEVSTAGGEVPSIGRLIGRNLPLAGAMALGALPDPLGLAGLFVASLVLLGEATFLMLTGRRVGDLLTGTRT